MAGRPATGVHPERSRSRPPLVGRPTVAEFVAYLAGDEATAALSEGLVQTLSLHGVRRSATVAPGGSDPGARR
jgi:hypothetical protein